jgi:hypothetical protein
MKKSAPHTAASKPKIKRDPIPENFRTLEELWEFWDTHSTADYAELLKPVKVSVHLVKGAKLLRVADDLVFPLQRRARQHGLTLEALVNRWIRERLRKVG